MTATDDQSDVSTAPRWRVAALLALKFAVITLVLAFVGKTIVAGWRELTQRELTVAMVPAVAAGIAYFGSQSVMAHFWRRVLLALGQPAPWRGSFAAFYLSQIGKYVPGKASVVLIRTERLVTHTRRNGQAPLTRIVAASVFYETLLFMATGSLLSAGLSFAVAPGDWRIVGLAFGLALVCIVPTLPPVFRWLLRKVAPPRGGGDASAAAEILPDKLTYGLALRGVVASIVAWTLAGVSVYWAAESVGATGGVGLENLRLWTLAATLPAVAGFVSLLPGGLIVREALALGLLAPTIGEANALATAVAARLVWVTTEALLCASLLGGGFVRNRRTRNPSDGPP